MQLQKPFYLFIGVTGYAAGMVGLVLFILFAGGWRVGSLSIDTEPSMGIGAALAVNVGLVAVFGLQHTVMARPWFKRLWTRIIPKPIERSIYCVATAAAIGLLCFGWQGLPGVVWSIENSTLAWMLYAVQLAGWATTVASSFMISHAELFGLQQVGTYARGATPIEPSFKVRGLYRIVRHPLQMGVLIGLWVTPHMSTSHMLFAALLSAYVLVGLHHEERDLVAVFGEDYLAYKRRVPMLVPFKTPSASASPAPANASPADSAA